MRQRATCGPVPDQDEEDRWEPVLAAVDAEPAGSLAAQLATPWRLTLALAAFREGGDPSWLLPSAPGMSRRGSAEVCARVDSQLLGSYAPAAAAPA